MGRGRHRATVTHLLLSVNEECSTGVFEMRVFGQSRRWGYRSAVAKGLSRSRSALRRWFDSVPGHHEHYTVVAAEKVDIPGHYQHLAVRGFFWGEHQLFGHDWQGLGGRLARPSAAPQSGQKPSVPQTPAIP